MTTSATSSLSNTSYLNSRPALPVLAQAAVAFAVLVTKWSIRHKTRKELRHLSADQLKDIGISRQEAHYQGTLPFWRP
ncbi:DUF1127 domain-containing protein [Phaeobacter sp. 11ANDIMAR09]|uniref:DUF1127 domain-containing protein n=1 Tax=Phaeobacter sp. 11ANDIMAR09 TaxID=1225647 RepID=UPI0006C8682C|nr:DUF1127 domain-containing protein [Phaeobacter sp. 11ANDIMAR09]KPD12016.1 hypothetical protein AN476_12560 [Phaeobacter sp. 11ANDIMAR09]OIQ34136.1 MAG: hypothetical protein BM559_08030 [Roseobacter sp. MedPE-SWchi]